MPQAYIEREDGTKIGPHLPLGILHTEEYTGCREALMKDIAAEQAANPCLRGYSSQYQREPELIPCAVEIDWFAGPDRENGDSPDFPNVEYHCDVSA